ELSKSNFKQAELAARSELQTIAVEFSRGNWDVAMGSSGSARMLCDILEMSGYSGGITRSGLEQLRVQLLKAGNVRRLELPGLKPDRVPVLPGGFAIMNAAFCELGIEQIQPALGALREGVLYDLLGRFHHHDMRDATVQQFMRRYHVDMRQAARVTHLANRLASQLLGGPLPGAQADEDALQLLERAAKLHEIGISVAHSGYHKHTAYILKNADMPGFSKKEQERLSLLALAHRGRLDKMRGLLASQQDIALAMALRLAALFYRNRSDILPAAMQAHFAGNRFYLMLDPAWLAQNPLTEAALQEEVKQWKDLGVGVQLTEMETQAVLLSAIK
ncbi:MAG: exopolyphosphatase / guanosine-5'-triphosphate 3'-diphosphate pyrophosphatase, partial [Gallionellaceae bacterium]